MWAITKIIRPSPVSAMMYLEPTDDKAIRDNRFILNLSTTDRVPPFPIGQLNPLLRRSAHANIAPARCFYYSRSRRRL